MPQLKLDRARFNAEQMASAMRWAWLAVMALTCPVSGQSCPSTESAKITPGFPETSSSFGRALAVSGDWLIAGDGPVEFRKRVNGIWTPIQAIVPPAGGSSFGTAIDIDGDLAVIGAPLENSSNGAAYVYRFNGTQWLLEQRLSLISVQPAQFGRSVAVQNGIIVVGGTREMYSAQPLQRGGAYVHEYNGREWTLTHTLLPPNNLAWFDVGATVDLDGDTIAVGMPYSGVDGFGNPITNAVFVYRWNGSTWALEQQVVPPDGELLSGFAQRMVLDGDSLVVSSPLHDINGSNDEGRVHAFARIGGTWTQMQTLQSPENDGECCDRFGIGLALRNDVLVIGTPYVDVTYPQDEDHPQENAGLAHVYRRIGGQWLLDRQLRQRWREPGLHATVHDEVEWDYMGFAVAISDGQLLIGSPYSYVVNGFDRGQALAYSVTATDCDANGAPDHCETIDCNHNAIHDVCELLEVSSTDCDDNSIPDECDAGFTYLLEDGTAYSAWGFGAVDFDYLWFNTFRVKPGGQWITHAAMSWTRYAPDLLSGQALIYADPNHDGNPSDALLLNQSEIVSRIDFAWTWPIPFVTYDLPPTFVGEPGTTFFLGFVLTSPADKYPATSIGTGGLMRGWSLATPAGQLDPSDPQSAGFSFQPKPTFAVRAIGLDCNNNGTPDACDISGGASPDANLNGIPDECEPQCPADIVPDIGDGDINVEDLLAVIGDWGPCIGRCDGDVTFNDIVDIGDLMAVIGAWGSCGK